MFFTLKQHWPEYLIEATGLSVLVATVCSFAMLLFHPDSPFVGVLPSAIVRHLLMGLVIGGTSAALVYSRWGKQSGAHFNPAVTLTYYRLGKVQETDAVWYVISQMAGALLGIMVMVLLFRSWLSHPTIHFAANMPGAWGSAATWLVEFSLSCILMTIILTVSNSKRYARWTGLFAALLSVLNVAALAPWVGTSMNPARAFASAIPAQLWSNLWIYLTAAPLGMLFAARGYLRRHGMESIFCAKLHHENRERCIFCQTRAERKAQETNDEACNPLPPVASNREITFSCNPPLVIRQEPIACPRSATTM